MAHFIRGTGSDLTPTQHSNNIFREHLRRSPYANLMGKKDSGQPIIVDNTLKGQCGDTVRYHFVPQDDSDGIKGQNASILGNEKVLDEYFMDLKIDQMAQAYAKRGKMTDKRTIWKIRAMFKEQLTNWFRDKHAYWLTMAMTGYMSNGYDFVDDFAAEDVVNGDGRLMVAKGSSGFKMIEGSKSSETDLLTDYDGSGGKLATTDVMNTYLLDELEIMAKEGNSDYRMTPVKSKNGEEYFILHLCLRACTQLRQDARFEKRLLSLAEAGVDPSKDVFATGALGIWNNIIIKKNEFIHRFKDSSGNKYARNLLPRR